MSEAETRRRALLFLREHTTLALGTVGESGAPAVAAVFYAADDDLNLFFLTEERTEHGRNMLANPQVAGAIHADGQDWRSIRGLQLRGRAAIAAGGELPHAVKTYAGRYAFVASLLAGQSGPAALTGPLARARFWVLRPSWIRLIDNTVRFGYKEELLLPEAE
ncbi:MAG: pyridoxamine 5'-phosphate oxidase family protein [Anaerolineae bacterium]|jgi:uncharacterized protein YhbP (UPF0306 family)|nr:pyridoxamine 5'-phosphate oxidase family protein [Anaerolineae bacterium]